MKKLKNAYPTPTQLEWFRKALVAFLRTPPRFGEVGAIESTTEAWLAYILPLFTTEALLSLGFTLRDIARIRAAAKRRKKNGGVSKRGLVAERRAYVAENPQIPINKIAERFGVSHDTIERDRSMLRVNPARSIQENRILRISLVKTILARQPNLSDEDLAKTLRVKKKMVGVYRREAGFYKRPDRRRQKPAPLRLAA